MHKSFENVKDGERYFRTDWGMKRNTFIKSKKKAQRPRILLMNFFAFSVYSVFFFRLRRIARLTMTIFGHMWIRREQKSAQNLTNGEWWCCIKRFFFLEKSSMKSCFCFLFLSVKKKQQVSFSWANQLEYFLKRCQTKQSKPAQINWVNNEGQNEFSERKHNWSRMNHSSTD